MTQQELKRAIQEVSTLFKHPDGRSMVILVRKGKTY